MFPNSVLVNIWEDIHKYNLYVMHTALQTSWFAVTLYVDKILINIPGKLFIIDSNGIH